MGVGVGYGVRMCGVCRCIWSGVIKVFFRIKSSNLLLLGLRFGVVTYEVYGCRYAGEFACEEVCGLWM